MAGSSMASTWNKLKKSLSLPLSSQPSIEAARSSDIPEKDFRGSTNMSSSSSSSSSDLRISRTSSCGTRSSKRTCAICLGNMKPGQGQAIFTAECSHSFHFNCIASSVKHGNQLCPICRSKWNDIPFPAPTSAIDPQLNGIGRARVAPLDSPPDEFHASLHRHLPPQPSLHPEPHHFSDDEPLLATSLRDSTSPSLSAHPVATVRAFPEFPAVPAADDQPTFAVLVGVKAPALPENTRHHDHAPIDLVTVLDVSGSMAGTKLALLKRAVRFVIRNLGPADRLAIVAFSSTARRIFPLHRMSDAGRDHAVMAINSLRSTGGTNIVEGLRKGVRVLEERRQKNPVASIILLSDGKDTYNVGSHNYRRNPHNEASPNSRRVLDYLNLLPSSICPNNSASREESRVVAPFPVHTFGFGSDHDAAAMHAISDASGGMFSFIQTASIIQDAFARCIGGLLSVVAQELRLTVTSLSPGVSIGSITAGKYSSEILNQGQIGGIEVGDLYADEQKDFLVHVSVPVFSAEECGERGPNTSLLCVGCSYKGPVSQEIVQAESKIVDIRRPRVLSSEDNTMSLEVDRQRNRLWVADGITEAQSMAEKGNLEGAQATLAARRSALLASASAQAGDGLCNWLEAELKEIRDRMVSRELYEQTGRAYVLSGLSSHSWQRATTRGDSTTHTTVFNRDGDNQNMSGAIGYETPSMVSMVTRSRIFDTRNGGSPEQAYRLNRSSSLV